MAIEFTTQPDEAAKKLFHDLVRNPDDYPDDVREKIIRLLEPGRSVAFAVSEAAEIIYARKSELPHRLVKLGAELAMTASYNRINNFADDNGRRGEAITSALRRHSREKTPPGIKWPSVEEDPSPKDVYLPPVDSGVTQVATPEPPIVASDREKGED